MIITRNTTVKEILDTNEQSIKIFETHGVDVPLECDDSILDTELEICESMCHIDDLDALIIDLQTFFNQKE